MNRGKKGLILTKALKTLINNRSGAVVGVDLGASAFKVAEVSWHKGLPRLQAAGVGESLLAEREDVEAAADQLRRLLMTAGISAKQAVFAAGGRNVFIRQLPYPRMPLNELREAVRWDMEKYVPYEADSYYYDIAPLPDRPDDKDLSVLLVAVPKHSVDYMTAVVKAAGLTPLAADIESLAAARTVLNGEDFILLDIGGELSQVFLYQSGCPVVARSLTVGGRRFSEVIGRARQLSLPEAERLKCGRHDLFAADTAAEDDDLLRPLDLLIEELAREVNRTLEYYRMHNPAATVDRIVVCGGGARLDKLLPQLAGHLELPVALHNPLESMDVAAAFEPRQLKQVSPQLSLALGLALRGGEGV